jgi:sugar phosphate isomerase/epimerase
MTSPRLGLNIDDLRMAAKDAISTAAELRFRDIEIGAAAGEITPDQLSDSGRRHFRRYVQGFGLDLACLAADVAGTRLTDPRTVDERVQRTCRVIEFAKDLGVPIVTASVGALTHPETGEPSALAIEALTRIGEVADARGVVYAIRPSYDSGDRLLSILNALRCPAIRLGLDPAAMVMTGASPLAAIERLAGHIGLFHVRDATAGLAERPGKETRLGEGDIDLVGLAELLDAAAYRGPHIIRRTDTATPLADIRHARDYLDRELRGG